MKKKIINNLFTYVIGLVIAFFYMLSVNTNFNNMFGLSNKNYILDFSGKQIIIIFILSILNYFLIFLIEYLYKENGKYIFSKYKFSKKRIIIYFFIINLFWLPYYLSFFPGNAFYDGLYVMQEGIFHMVTNRQTLLFNLFIKPFVWIGSLFNNYLVSIFLFNLIQAIIVSLVISYFIYFLHKYQVNKIYCYLALYYFCLFGIFPLNAITVWKDTYFSIIIFLYILKLIDIITLKCDISSTKECLKLLILMFLIMFLRNNGIFVILFTYIIILFTKFNNSYYKKLKRYSLFLIVVAFIIQYPLYNILSIKEPFVESIGMPMQQIGYIVTNNGDYDKEEKYFSKVWDLEEVKNRYTPTIADTMKWYLGTFDEEYLEKTKLEFFKNYLSLIIRNPKMATKAFFLENMGFWHVSLQVKTSYAQQQIDSNFPYKLKQTNLFYKLFNKDINNYLTPPLVSSGLLFMIIIVCMVISFILKGTRTLIPFLPLIGLWFTIMLATPIAICMRYVLVFAFCIPLVIILPCIVNKYLD